MCAVAVVAGRQAQPASSATPNDDFAAICTPQLATDALPDNPQTVLPQTRHKLRYQSRIRHPALSTLSTHALLIIPYSEDHYLNLGRELHDKGNYQGAIAAYDQAIQLNPYNDNAYDDRAQSRAQIGDLSAAIADYDRAIDLNPEGSSNALIERGYLRLELKDWQGANADFTRLIEQDSYFGADVIGYGNRCIARAALGDLAGATADYKQYRQRVLKPVPPVIRAYSPAPEPEPIDARGYFKRGLQRLSEDSAEARALAVADFNQVIEREPRLAAAYYYRGVAQFQSANDNTRAIADLTRTLELDPTFGSAYYSRGIVRVFMANSAGAIDDLKRLVEQQPDNKKAFAIRSSMYLLLGDAQLAQADFNHLVRKLRLTPAQAYRYRAEALIVWGTPDFAIADYTEAIKQDPQNAENYGQRAQLRYQLGDCKGANADNTSARQVQQRAYEIEQRAYKEQIRAARRPRLFLFHAFPRFQCPSINPKQPPAQSDSPIPLIPHPVMPPPP